MTSKQVNLNAMSRSQLIEIICALQQRERDLIEKHTKSEKKFNKKLDEVRRDYESRLDEQRKEYRLQLEQSEDVIKNQRKELKKIETQARKNTEEANKKISSYVGHANRQVERMYSQANRILARLAYLSEVVFCETTPIQKVNPPHLNMLVDDGDLSVSFSESKSAMEPLELDDLHLTPLPSKGSLGRKKGSGREDGPSVDISVGRDVVQFEPERFDDDEPLVDDSPAVSLDVSENGDVVPPTGNPLLGRRRREADARARGGASSRAGYAPDPRMYAGTNGAMQMNPAMMGAMGMNGMPMAAMYGMMPPYSKQAGYPAGMYPNGTYPGYGYGPGMHVPNGAGNGASAGVGAAGNAAGAGGVAPNMQQVGGAGSDTQPVGGTGPGAQPVGASGTNSAGMGAGGNPFAANMLNNIISPSNATSMADTLGQGHFEDLDPDEPVDVHKAGRNDAEVLLEKFEDHLDEAQINKDSTVDKEIENLINQQVNNVLNNPIGAAAKGDSVIVPQIDPFSATISNKTLPIAPELAGDISGNSNVVPNAGNQVLRYGATQGAVNGSQPQTFRPNLNGNAGGNGVNGAVQPVATNGVQPVATNGVQPVPNGVQPIGTNGAQQTGTNGMQPVLNGAQPVPNGTQPVPNGVQPIPNSTGGFVPIMYGQPQIANGAQIAPNGAQPAVGAQPANGAQISPNGVQPVTGVQISPNGVQPVNGAQPANGTQGTTTAPQS